MLTHEELRAKALRRSGVRKEFERAATELALLDQFLEARARQGLTQAQLAERMGTTQSAIARMESDRGRHSPSISTLSRYAEALGCTLEIRLVPKPAGSRRRREAAPDAHAAAASTRRKASDGRR